MGSTIVHIYPGRGVVAEPVLWLEGLPQSNSCFCLHGHSNSFIRRLVGSSAFGQGPVMLTCFIPPRINRPYFEKRAQIALRRQPEMLDIHAYYSRPKSSGFWIFEYHEKVMGLIAIDASDEATSGRSKKTASSIATIRHFYVDELYRGADVQSDLLAQAIQHAFRSDNRVQLIRATDSPLTVYTRQTLRKAGFQLETTTEKVGLFGWKVGTSVLSREQWEK
jgi:GNAT superfamily N-acetyltransferase